MSGCFINLVAGVSSGVGEAGKRNSQMFIKTEFSRLRSLNKRFENSNFQCDSDLIVQPLAFLTRLIFMMHFVSHKSGKKDSNQTCRYSMSTCLCLPSNKVVHSS
jgi:hypothetical protein